MGGFLPNADLALLAWSLNFSDRITATPTAFGLVAGDATSYAAAHTLYADALEACDPGERSKSLVLAKNSARTALKTMARFLAKKVAGTSTVTDAQKASLGLNVPAQPTPIPAPIVSPAVTVRSVNQNIVELNINNPTTGKRAKPAGVQGATIFSHVGATPPADITAWKFEGSVTKSRAAIEFPLTAEPFSKVWITAFYFNPTSESGPACTPISTNLGTWLVQSEAANNGDASGSQLKAA